MKKLVLLSTLIFTITSCSTHHPVSRSIASDPKTEILAETDEIKNNGKKGTKCQIVVITETERKVFAIFHFGETLRYPIYLFDILPDGSYGRRGYGRPDGRSEYLIAGKVPAELKKKDLKFEASAKKIEYSNGSMDRDNFTLKMENGDLSRVTYFKWQEGASNLNQVWLGTLSAIFGNDYHGNDGYCKF